MDGRDLSLLLFFCDAVFFFQLPNLSKQPHKNLKKNEAEKLEESEAEMKEEDYLFSTEELTESEKRGLNYKRTLRDVDVAEEEDERKTRFHMVEDKTRKVRPEGHTFQRRVSAGLCGHSFHD